MASRPSKAGRTKKGDTQRFIEQLFEHPAPEGCVIWPFAVDKDGYGKTHFLNRCWRAHRLVLSIYTGIWWSPKARMEAAHGPCHTPSCVNPAHLSWKTLTENQADRLRDDTHIRGERHGGAKTRAEVVQLIRRSNQTTASLARQHNLSEAQVYNIRKRKTWAWLR